MKRKTLILLDTNALLHRAWHALPPSMTSPDGIVVNAAYGVTSMVMKLLDKEKPDYVAAAFDMKGPTFRHQLAETYKATREKKSVSPMLVLPSLDVRFIGRRSRPVSERAPLALPGALIPDAAPWDRRAELTERLRY